MTKKAKVEPLSERRDKNVVPWPEGEGTHDIMLGQGQMFAHPTKLGRWLYGPKQIRFTRNPDGSVDLIYRADES